MSRPMPEMGQLFTYQAQAWRVIDGDTIEVILDHGCDIRSRQRLRLIDVWCPEMSEPAGEDAAWFLDDWLPVSFTSWPLMVETVPNRAWTERRSFNRYLAHVWRKSDGDYLNEAIIAAGHGTRERGQS